MTTLPVEIMVSDESLHNSKFLTEVAFNPREVRGTVLGLIGRLKHEPAIEKREETGAYKAGVTPLERKEILQKLFRLLSPVQGETEVQKLFMAINAELERVWEINMSEMLAAEARVAEAAEAQREANKLRREAELDKRREQEQEKEQETPCTDLVKCYMCEAEVLSNTMVEIEGEMVCSDCAKDWGVEEK